jgi:hypothetical protein
VFEEETDTDWCIVRRNANMPIPNVLAWSDDARNPVGCEYIIMDYAEGTALRQLWFQLGCAVQIKCIVSIADKIVDMARLNFPAYGSLYMRNSSVMSSADHILIDGDFCIGPSCDKSYWDCTVGEGRYYEDVAPDRGPCKSATSFAYALNLF